MAIEHRIRDIFLTMWAEPHSFSISQLVTICTVTTIIHLRTRTVNSVPLSVTTVNYAVGLLTTRSTVYRLMRLITLWSILSICVIRKAASSPDYPRVLNVTKIISLNAINDIWQEEKFPFINSKVYLNDLAMHVAVKKPKVVKVVIGPKDAGKSTGIVTLKKYWRQQGHVIVDVNLKGVSHHTNGKEAMYIISKQLKHQLSNFDMESYGLIYQCTKKNCFQDGSIGIMTVVITILSEICA